MTDLISRDGYRSKMISAVEDGYLDEDTVDAMINILDCETTVEAMPQWISVKERLPEVPCIVLWGDGNIDYAKCIVRVTMKGGKRIAFADTLIDAASLMDGTRVDFLCEGNAITHWMPLPPPPKEEEDAETV